MFRLKDFRLLWLISLAALFFATPALAQFEVSPGHFEPAADPARPAAAKHKANVAQPASSPVAQSGALAIAGAYQARNDNRKKHQVANLNASRTHHTAGARRPFRQARQESHSWPFGTPARLN
jgi:hypothetical protein